MKTKSFLLLFFSFLTLAPLSAQRVNEDYPFLSYWDFKFRGVPDSVDCRYYPNNELYLSGFDTDGKGTFYFAGGNPLRVSCFKGTELQWRRKVSDVHRVKLATDDIDEGVMHENYFVVRDKGFRDKKFYWLYNWETRQYKVSFFNYRGELAWTDEMRREYSIAMMRPLPYVPKLYANTDPWYYSKYYKGMFRDMHLFVDEGTSRFILTELGEIQYSYNIERDVRCDILPLWVFHDEIDIESHLSSPEGEILRGTHFYYVGYEGKNNRLMVVDIDLDKMFPEAKDWIKKKMN